jgi:hypothetical protein
MVDNSPSLTPGVGMFSTGLWMCFLVLVTSGCAHRDQFPMLNSSTGEHVVCYSGPYWFDEGLPQMRVATQCLQACARYGFTSLAANPNSIAPRDPDDDVKPFIPTTCMPSSHRVSPS